MLFQLKQLLLNPNNSYRKEIDSLNLRMERIEKVKLYTVNKLGV